MQAYAILFADFSAFSAFRLSPDRYCGLKAVNALKRRKIPFGIFSRFCGRLRIRTADPLLVRQML